MNNFATLLGGEEITIKKLDGSTETVRVRQIPVREYPRLLSIQDDEPAMIELLCGKEQGWSDSLAFESYDPIIKTGDKLNWDFFGSWVQRRLERQEKLIPGITAKRAGLQSPLTTGSQS